MWGRLGPRFFGEAAFLVALAVGVGLADLDPIVIVAVMAGGWLLVALIELVASRESRYAAPASRVVVEERPAAVAEPAAEPAPVTPALPEEEAAAPLPLAEPEGQPEPRRRSWFRRRRALVSEEEPSTEATPAPAEAEPQPVAHERDAEPLAEEAEPEPGA